MSDDENTPPGDEAQATSARIREVNLGTTDVARQAAEVKRFQEFSESMADATRPLREATERLSKQFTINPAMKNIAKLIGEQQTAIDDLDKDRPVIDSARLLPPDPPDLDLFIPPNPAHETNDRLERIEQRFAEMQAIAANAATIATGLQAYAAEFLHKFEKAADGNDRTANKAIWIAGSAAVIAVAVFLGQIAYAELHVVPRETEAGRAALAELRAEIEALRDTQILLADRMEQAARNSDSQTAAVLQELIELMSEQQATTATRPPALAAPPVSADPDAP